MKLQKKIISMLTIFMVVITGSGINLAVTGESVLASSKRPYQYLNTDGFGTPREKVGNYYIWTTNDSPEKLVCAKSLTGKKKTLKKISAKANKTFVGALVTNGSTIYYAIYNFDNKKTTIYRTNVNGAAAKKIKTVGRSFSRMAGYYNGCIYYMAHASNTDPNAGFNLVRYNIAKKKTTIAKKQFSPNSSYGKYFTGEKSSADTPTQYLYNAKTHTTKKLKKALDSQIVGKKIYYLMEVNSNTGIGSYQVKSSNLSGKSLKTVKTIKNAEPLYFGKKVAYFVGCSGSYDNGTITEITYKLVYKTKKLTQSSRYVSVYD